MTRRESLARHYVENGEPTEAAYAWADQIINLMEGETE